MKPSSLVAAGLAFSCIAVADAAAARQADDLNPVAFHKPPNHPPVVLVKDGAPLARIVVEEPGRVLGRAVQDLQSLVEATTGARIEIAQERGDGPAIVIGGALAEASGLTGDDMPVEGFTIKTARDTVFIVGNGDAGTTWGVNEFLERFAGVRWYWPEDRTTNALIGTSIEKRSTLTVEPVWLTDAPAFRKRHRYPSGGVRIGTTDMGSHDRRLRAASSWPVKLIVHAPHGWKALYAESRPEIFQLRSDGDRDYSMLCYGDPQTLSTYLEEIDAQLKIMSTEETVEGGRRIINGNAITVSPADMAVSCRCEHCQALWDIRGGRYGTASRVLGEFVANLAREVNPRWPEMTVIFLPYKNYTYAPEGVSFPDNVEIQICGMPGLAQYKDPVINASEQANIDAWVRLSGRKIQNWHYSCWPADRTKAAYLYPHVVKEHYLANRDKTAGTFINGIRDHWPRQHISLYAWLKVLWNPEFNVDAAIDEYCRRMYGPAQRPMRRLVGMLMDGWEKREWSKNSFSPKSVYEESYPRKDVRRMESLLEEAVAKAADDPLTTQRLAYYGGPLREFFAESKHYDEGTGVTPLVVIQTAENPRVDGTLDDAIWETVAPVSFVPALDRKATTSRFPTTLKAVWTRDGITFAFHMVEPEPSKMKRDIGADSRDASLIWWNDNVEIFLDVTGERAGYYQLIVNANGSLYDGKGKDTSWNSEGVKAASSVGDDHWTLEIFVPTRTFSDAITPGTGVEWFGNFTRHRVTDRTNREYQRLNTTYAGPSNDQNAFGPIRFVER